jgi:phosphoribosyl-dephospho-CoA transferase
MKTVNESIFRHTLVFLKAGALPLHCDCQENPLFLKWVEHKWPFVCTRQPQDQEPELLQLGLPYFDPVQKNKQRYAYCISKKDIQKISPLPLLREVFPTQLLRGCTAHVYGSYCWEYVTKHPYVTDGSDLDLLIHYENQSLESLLALVEHIEKSINMRNIDGEIRFKELGDCSLQELFQTWSKAVLFKTIDRVFLVDRAFIYEKYPTLLRCSAKDS